MTDFQDILSAAQALPSPERAQLIYALWDSVAPEEWAPPSQDWIAESQRRSAELDAGTISASPWPEVRERARRRAGLDE